MLLLDLIFRSDYILKQCLLYGRGSWPNSVRRSTDRERTRLAAVLISNQKQMRQKAFTPSAALINL